MVRLNLTAEVRLTHTQGMKKSLIDEVFEKAGGRAALRNSFDPPLSKQTMADWKRQGFVPMKRAVTVERITGIPRAKLCPDFDWGSAPQPIEHIGHPLRRSTDKKGR
jgi:hypothetical protein